MGFWSSVRERLTRERAPHDEAEPTPETAPRSSDERDGRDEQDKPAGETPPEAAAPKPALLSSGIGRLQKFGEEGGPLEDEALSLLESTRRTPEEGLALDSLVTGGRMRPLPERLALSVASALLDRGDRTSARSLLESTGGIHALVLRADLAAEAGDLAGAIALIERVLVRDLDLPGASERRTAWRSRLGLGTTQRAVDPTTMTVANPRARAPFDLVREVARGGAGVVFEAKDRELGRLVALKLYHQPDRDRAQLLDEGRVAVSLAGPGIVRVLDVDPNEGWLALEWAPLGALRRVLRDGQTALEPLEAWLPLLAEALARVHAAGWVHHDVKPANVLLSEEARGGKRQLVPWLGDFGSARRRGSPSPPGSMGYVSPERLAGRVSDPSDDVYGFGRVLEDVLAGLETLPAPSWRALAGRCVGPNDQRPSDGAALVEALRELGYPTG